MIIDEIKKRPELIILPDGGEFEITFSDGGIANEKDYSWNDIADYEVVDYMGQQRMVKLSKYPIKTIIIRYIDSETTLQIEDGDRVYTSIRSIATHGMDTTKNHKVLGRVVGIVRDGKIIEERFCDGTNVLGVNII